MNWGQLKTMAQNYTHRADIDLNAVQIPACDRLTQRLDVQDNEAVGAATLSAAADLLGLFEAPLPADYGRMKTVMVAGVSYAPTSLLLLAQGLSSGNQYAVSGNLIYANSSGAAVYAYGKQIQPIASDTATSVILTRYPRVYLYAVVIEALIQIQDFDGASGYAQAFDGAVDDANALQAFARFDSSMGVTPGFRRI